MDNFTQFITGFRQYRQKKLHPIGMVLIKIGMTANILTFISLLSGVGAAYFLFTNYILFLVLGLLHLAADSMDGVVASIQGKSTFGHYFDHGTDNFVAVLLMLKIGYFLQDYYAYLVAGLYLLAQLVYIFSKLTAPVLFGRSVSMITLFFYIPAVVSMTSYLPLLIYLFLGVIAVYSLARQLQWMIRTKFS